MSGTIFGGDAGTLTPAHLADHQLLTDAMRAAAALHPKSGEGVAGCIVDPTDDQHRRLAHFASATGRIAVPVRIAGFPDPVPTYVHTLASPVGLWDAAHWRAHHAALEVAMASDVMALMGVTDPAEILRRHAALRVRAASRLRAQDVPPSTRRQSADATAVTRQAMRQPYARFFAVEEYDLTVRRFDGATSPRMTRAVFVTGDAVTVLPYDPVRDRVLLIEQFRPGPLGRGDPVPWSLEAIAGRIDPGETPEEAARREAVEEAGLTLGHLWPVANYYPSPAGKTEFIYSYVAEADLPDDVAGIHGLAEEAEDIKGHLVSFATLMEMVASGEVGNAPVILTAFWLARERPRLRAAAGAG